MRSDVYSIFIEMSASCPNVSQKGLSFVFEWTIILYDHKTQGNSFAQAPFIEFNLFFNPSWMICLIDLANTFV